MEEEVSQIAGQRIIKATCARTRWQGMSEVSYERALSPSTTDSTSAGMGASTKTVSADTG